MSHILTTKSIHLDKNILCIDIDNVIALTDKVMRAIIFRYTNGRVDLSYEDIKDFDYCKVMDRKGNSITKNEWANIHDLFSRPRSLLRIKPYSGIQGHLSTLSVRYDIHIVTSRLKIGWPATINWLERHNVPHDGVHFVEHLKKHIVLGKVGAVVEDDFQQAMRFAESGIKVFLMEHPWNVGKSGKENMFWVSGWDHIVNKLMDN